MSTTPLPASSEILLLCDSAKLARAIELILHANGQLQTVLLDRVVLRPNEANHWDLVLIAFSKPVEGPLDELLRASLIQWAGCRPMLLIAPDPFACAPGGYLAFPFDAQTLSDRVAEILSATTLWLTAAVARPALVSP
jgi:hypothetical protein